MALNHDRISFVLIGFKEHDALTKHDQESCTHARSLRDCIPFFIKLPLHSRVRSVDRKYGCDGQHTGVAFSLTVLRKLPQVLLASQSVKLFRCGSTNSCHESSSSSNGLPFTFEDDQVSYPMASYIRHVDRNTSTAVSCVSCKEQICSIGMRQSTDASRASAKNW